MSQIPSEASRRARRAAVRHARCPVCSTVDVTGSHVDRCEEMERYRLRARTAVSAAGVPAATGMDLWAHLHSRTHNALTACLALEAVLDLGWRPVVGSNATRLWSAES
jgi:hypothetical protein